MDYLSKSDVVAQGIRGLLQSGELAPGDVLRQRDLAKRFGVSPTPVREALRKLEAEGFIATELHRGAVVVRAEDARLFENFLIRANLESLAAGLAAQKVTPEDLAEISRILDEMSKLAPDDARRTALNRQFHFRIYESARSPTLLALLNLLWRSLDGGPRVDRPREVSDQHHQMLVQALSRGDSNAAAEYTRLHIMEAANHSAAQDASEAASEAASQEPLLAAMPATV
jgi:DNA-binding GntR family transcriptional regulator